MTGKPTLFNGASQAIYRADYGTMSLKLDVASSLTSLSGVEQ